MADVGSNVRYYGANPNNYIYFNCSDYSNQTSDTCELWRIIGVFNGKVKIIRNSSIGVYSWDNKDTSTGAETDYGKNDWTTARLMKLLNPSSVYEIDPNDNGYGQSLYWNSESGTCYSGFQNATTTCDFTSTGLKNDETRNLVSQSIWSLLGKNEYNISQENIYNAENGAGGVYSGRPTSWTGYVAIPYASDFGYAVDLNLCKDSDGNTHNLLGYNQNVCKNNHWMKNIFNSNGGWTLTSFNGNTSNIFHVRSNYGFSPFYESVCSGLGVSPTLYLNSDQEIESNNIGSSTDPYRLVVG